MDETKPLSKAMRWISIVMGVDPDILVQSPTRERVTLLSEFMLLMLVALISGVAWTAFWSQFLRVWIGLIFGIVAAVFIFLLDRAIVTSDWSLAGILRHPAAKYGREFWARLTIRFLVTFILGFATSTGATMGMFGEAIATQLDKITREENQRIEDRYTGMLHEFLARHFGVQLAEIDKLSRTIATTTPALDEARQHNAEALARVQAARDDKAKELTGPDGRPRGAGPRFFAAEDREKAAAADVAKANTNIAIYTPRLDDAQKRLRAATEKFEVAQATVKTEIDDLETEKKSHSVVGRRDALLSYMALQQLYKDPNYGADARHFGWMMMAVLMTIELSFFAVRIIFAQASLSTLILVKQTRELAAKADAEHELKIHEIRTETAKSLGEIGFQEPRPPLRIVNVEKNRD